ncbi:MAG: GTP cyclohydrolase FolE2, partial [Lysobacterales bacterium]
SPQSSAASINAWVDLVDDCARGIHMSRLYNLLQSRLANQTIERQMICDALDAMLASQAHLSRRAQLDISADVLLLRPALVSALAGWQRYPVTCRARKLKAGYSFEIELGVGYSSTCPSSAALARHAQSHAFLQRFGDRALGAADVAAWLDSPLGATATAHAQRSEARVRVRFGANAAWPDVKTLVDRCEAALGTPLQTAVKRIDEQAFAMRNAENLMFCEDAARRLHAAFVGDSQLEDFEIRVAHFESLHAHDAVASVSRSGAYRTLAMG